MIMGREELRPLNPRGEVTKTTALGLEGQRLSSLSENSIYVRSTKPLDIYQSYIQLTEITAPGAGAANTVRIYAVVDGGGLTDLAAVFQDGTVDLFAQEV